jgi:hypothetical protein
LHAISYNATGVEEPPWQVRNRERRGVPESGNLAIRGRESRRKDSAMGQNTEETFTARIAAEGVEARVALHEEQGSVLDALA